MMSASEHTFQCKRVRLRFSLRTFFAVSVLGAVGLGMYLRAVVQQRTAVAMIQRYGGTVQYDYEVSSTGEVWLDGTSWIPVWLRYHLGDDFFHEVARVNLVYDDQVRGRNNTVAGSDKVLHGVGKLTNLRTLLLCGNQVSDDGLCDITALRHLEHLYMWDATGVTNRGTAHLRKLKRLQYIHLSNSQIGDDSLKTFASLPDLKGLALEGNRFSDVGLSYLRDMKQLKGLWIGDGQHAITDKGLEHLHGVENLEELDLRGTSITQDGLRHLTALPHLRRLFLGGTQVRNADQFIGVMRNCKVELGREKGSNGSFFEGAMDRGSAPAPHSRPPIQKNIHPNR